MLSLSNGEDLLPRVSKANLKLRLAISHTGSGQTLPHGSKHELPDDSTILADKSAAGSKTPDGLDRNQKCNSVVGGVACGSC